MTLTEPYAVVRYLARLCGLCGHDPMKDYQADWLLEVFAYWRDLLSSFTREPLYPDSFYNEPDESTVDAYLTEIRPKHLGDLERILEMNETTFLLSNYLSWVDLPIFSILYEDNVFVYTVVKNRVVEHVRQLAKQRDDVSSMQDAQSSASATDQEQDKIPLMPLAEFEDMMNKHITLVEEQFPRVAKFMDSVPRVGTLLAGWLAEHRQIWNLAAGNSLEVLQPSFESAPNYGPPRSEGIGYPSSRASAREFPPPRGGSENYAMQPPPRRPEGDGIPPRPVESYPMMPPRNGPEGYGMRMSASSRQFSQQGAELWPRPPSLYAGESLLWADAQSPSGSLHRGY
eukprot:Protomagalhaensia_sp_Gyna_25__5547@NODE_754_length_2688_cov_148_911287_g592_i0_p1_GENE_NODE_754_length_2688_cov_148_911287_g592_i0NODE_754_length_2688_cov_148_911287_g592_i0_p1_ORF_typecomplete_len342_score37_83GST_C_3/PF14497_6/2_7e06GST_C_3/PF14497_6/3_4e02GST_C/PF00043_25/0_0036GST_C/PF00043_25/6_5e02GST_C_5/PF16865_5/0_79GST_C_5/PF16865_5/1_2e03_NODE_754_length_2688_cov_148_911287_g592_i05921617